MLSVTQLSLLTALALIHWHLTREFYVFEGKCRLSKLSASSNLLHGFIRFLYSFCYCCFYCSNAETEQKNSCYPLTLFSQNGTGDAWQVLFKMILCFLIQYIVLYSQKTSPSHRCLSYMSIDVLHFHKGEDLRAATRSSQSLSKATEIPVPGHFSGHLHLESCSNTFSHTSIHFQPCSANASKSGHFHILRSFHHIISIACTCVYT